MFGPHVGHLVEVREPAAAIETFRFDQTTQRAVSTFSS